jgi:hypothetical protein
MKSNQHDYLKYWRVVRQFMKIKYGLTQADLDMLLFLYSEKYFDKNKFEEFDKLLGWDNQRFNRLRQEGWIQSFRNKMTAGGRRAIYQLSLKSTSMIQSIYRKLSGEEIPASESYNRMFHKNVSYSDRVYREMIIEMNKTIKQQRHQTPE